MLCRCKGFSLGLIYIFKDHIFSSAILGFFFYLFFFVRHVIFYLISVSLKVVCLFCNFHPITFLFLFCIFVLSCLFRNAYQNFPSIFFSLSSHFPEIYFSLFTFFWLVLRCQDVLLCKASEGWFHLRPLMSVVCLKSSHYLSDHCKTCFRCKTLK